MAQEKGIYGTGHHRDLREFAPKATQCSSVWVWDRFLEPEIKKIATGAWEPSPYGAFLSIKDGGTDIACCGDAGLAGEQAEKIMAERRRSSAASTSSPARSRTATARSASRPAQVLGDADLWAMDWYVDGVISQQ